MAGGRCEHIIGCVTLAHLLLRILLSTMALGHPAAPLILIIGKLEVALRIQRLLQHHTAATIGVVVRMLRVVLMSWCIDNGHDDTL